MAAGLATAGLYVTAAAVGGRMSPLARAPLLDGLAPAAPYRWVTPPPELAAGNLPPASGNFSVPLGPDGSRPLVLTTDDVQVTLIVTKGLFPPSGDDREVAVTVEPLDAATLGPPPGDLSVTGNAYLIEASYEPSGERVNALSSPGDLILVYPSSPGPHSSRTLLVSEDGSAWEPIETTDVPALQQAGGEWTSLGYFAVAASPSRASPTSEPSSGLSGLPLVLLVAGLSGLLVGAGLMARVRRR